MKLGSHYQSLEVLSKLKKFFKKESPPRRLKKKLVFLWQTNRPQTTNRGRNFEKSLHEREKEQRFANLRIFNASRDRDGGKHKHEPFLLLCSSPFS